MNKIYRLVWNKSLNLWTVVSENARGVTKKRNVAANISIKTATSLSNPQYQQVLLKPSLIAIALSSIFFSTGIFAATNTGGGSSSNGSSMAISPTAAQCGSTGGEASITNGTTGNGGGSVAMGCGNSISGTDSTWQQRVVNRRGDGNVAYGAGVPTGDTGGVLTGSTAVGRQNSITGQGGATVVGTANASRSSSQFQNVLIGQGNSSVGTGGYNTLMGVGNQVVDATNATPDGTGVGTNSIAIGIANRVTGQTAIAFGRQSYADADYSIAQGNVATVNKGATGGIALGFSATVDGKQGVAIGSASGVRNYDPATSARANEDAVAVGTRTNASTLESVAIGAGSEVTGTDVTLQQQIGNRRGTGTNNYPSGANNYLSRGTAVGQNNKISNLGAGTAIGSNNTISPAANASSAGYNIVIGQGNIASDGYNTALGIGNDVSKGTSNTAIGVNNIANGNTAIAMGRGTNALADFSIAQGNTATVASGATGGIALGNSANTTGVRGIAIGSSTGGAQNDTASAPNAIGTDAIALGTGAKGTSDNDIAIGRNAATAAGSGGDNIAMGNGVVTGATGKNVAIGSEGTTANSRTGDGGAVSIGRGQRATGDGAVAIGDPNVANGDGAIALGKDNIAAGDTAGNTVANGAVALGYENQAIGQGSVALGHTSVAAAAGAIALGDNANAQASRGVAMGSNAVATNVNDVALGSGSVTSAANPTSNGTVGDITYNYAGTSPSSVVSVGSEGNERQITNVAAGRVSESSTDAINGSQLYSTQQALGNLAESTANHLGGNSVVNSDGSITAPSYIVNETPINNVGDAIEALDQGWNLQTNGAGADAIKAGDTVDIGTVTGEENLTVTKNGNTIQYGLNKDLKVDSVTAGDTLINDNGVSIANGPSMTKDGINAGDTTVSNVADGVAPSDAVNKGQLDKAAAASKTEVTEGKNITVTKTTGADGQDIYNVATADDVSFDSVQVGDVNIDGTTGKISGVTAGEVSAASDEAINGSQLAGTAKSVSDALGGGSTVNPDGTVTAPSYTVNGETVRNVGDAITELDKGWNLQSNGANAGAIRTGDTVDIGTVNGEENLTVTKDGNNIKYGLNRDLKVDSVRAGDTLINDNGVTIANGPSITKSGINAAGNPISNVGAGVEDTDAVNKGQLDKAAAAAKTEVTQGKNITVSKTTGADGQDIYNVATADNVDFNNVTVGGANGVNIDGATGKISGVTAGEVSATSDEAINGSQLAGTAKSVSDALGGGSTVNPDGTVTAPSYTVNGNNVSNVGAAISELDKGWNLQSNGANGAAIKAGDTVDIGTATGEENLTVSKNGNTIQYGLNKDLKVDRVTAGDTVINTDGVTIANGPSITKSGINAAGNPISNVGAGVEDTDAVNKGQLDKAAAAAKTEVTQGKNITVSKTTGADGQDIYNVATADNVDFNNVTVGGANGVNIDGATGKVSGVTAGEVSATSDEAINGSQLAGTAKSVSDALGGGSTVNPDGTVTAPSYTVNGNNVTNVGAAISELDKGWNLQTNGANAGAVKAGDTVDIGTVNGEENLTVTKDGNNIKYGLNRDLKVDSVRAGDTLINDNGVSIANGPSMTKDGINAGDTTVSNVADGVAPSDAVNKGQLDKAAAASKTEVTQGKNITVSKTTGADGQDIYNVATKDDVSFDSVQVGDVNIDGTTGKISGVADGTIAAGSKDAVNGGQLNDSVASTGDILGGGVTNEGGKLNGPFTVSGKGYDTVADAIQGEAAAAKTEVTEGKNVTVTKTTGADGQDIYNVETKDDVSFDSVQVGDVNIDGTTGKISGVTDGTIAAGSKDAVNGGQLHGVADSVRNSIGGETTLNPDGSITTANVGNTGQNNIHDAIDSVRGAAVAAKTEVEAGKNMTVESRTGADGQTIYEVATADDVDFNNVTVGGANGVNIDGTTGKISGVADGTVAAGSKDAVNGGQLNDSVASTGDILGGGVTNEGGKLNGPFTVSGKGYDTVADAIQGEAAAAKTEVTEGKNVTVTKTTGADGQDIYNVATKDDVSFDSVQVGDVNIDGTTGKISGVADGTIAAGSKDAVNGGQLHGIADSVKNSIGGETTLNPDGSITTGNVGNTGQNNIHDAIDSVRGQAVAAKTTVTEGDNMVVTQTKNADGSTNYEVATARDVDFDSVQVGDVNIDAATGKISGVADGTVAAGSKDAVNGGQLNDSVASTGDILGGGVTNEGGKLNGPFTVSGKGYDTVADAIQGEAAAAKTEVTEGKNVTVTKTTGADGQDIYNVATKDDVSFDSVQVGDVNIDGTTGKISGVTDGTVAAGSKDAVNGGQLNDSIASTGDILGGGVTNEGGKLNGPFTVNDKGYDTVADAIQGEAAAAKTEVTEGKNVTVTKTTGADGQDIYNVATKDDVSFDSVQVGDVNIDGTTGKISGVADGTIAAGSTEAINGGQIHAIADSVKNSIGGETTLNPDGSITTGNVGNTGQNNIHDAIDSVRGQAVAAKTTVTEGDNIVVTQSKNADGSTNYEVATAKDVKFDSVTATDADGNETILDAKGVSLKDQAGNTTILGQDGLGFADPMGNSVGPRISARGIDAGNTVITGVAPGRIADDSTDAINGSQLKGVADSVAGAIGGNTTVNSDGSINTSNIGGTGKDNINDAIGAVGKAAQEAKTTVSKAAGDENVTVTSRQNADGSTDYEVGLSKDVKVDSVTAGDTVINGDGLTIAGGPSVTKDGIDAGDNKVTGVANGTVAAGSKDAINGGQLHGVADSVRNVVGGNAKVNPDGSITTSNVGGTGKNNIDDAINSVRGAAAAAKSTVSNKDGNISVNETTKADGSKDYEVGLAKDIQVDSVTAANQVNVGGAGGTTIAADGVRIAEGPSITKGGIDAGSRKVTAVAEGAITPDSKDAINGSQLHKSYENVAKALGGGAGYDPSAGWTAPSYQVGGNTHNNVGDALNALNNADQALGDRITNLGDQMQQAFYDTNQRIDDVKKMANAGVAAAMALETAPYISGKYTYAVGAAYHGGENAVGLTLRKTADNGRWSLTTGVAAASQGDPSFRVGLSGVFD